MSAGFLPGFTIASREERPKLKMIIRNKADSAIVKIILAGGVGILRTDTIYGLVGSALKEKTIERIYRLRHRHPKKPMIILISSLEDSSLFNIRIDAKTKKILNKSWPGKLSIIFPCKSKKFSYLHRGVKTLAFRLSAKKSLIKLLKKTGPLVAPSANPEGESPAKTIGEAKKYFGDKVDFYIDSGRACSRPSTLVELKNGQLIVKRAGAAKINNYGKV